MSPCNWRVSQGAPPEGGWAMLGGWSMCQGCRGGRADQVITQAIDSQLQAGLRGDEDNDDGQSGALVPAG